MWRGRACVIFVSSLLGGALSTSCRDVLEIDSHFKRVAINAAEGGVIEVFADESPRWAGTRLVIPADALASDCEITLDLLAESIALAPDVAAGPAVMWGPAGTEFHGGAALTLPLAIPDGRERAAVFVEVLEDDGRRRQYFQPKVQIDAPAAFTTLSVTTFSAFQNGARGCPSSLQPSERMEPMCPPGTHCVDGICELVDAAEPEVCDDALDNDADGTIDCDDYDCTNFPACAVDCRGERGGPAYRDQCGVCDADATNDDLTCSLVCGDGFIRGREQCDRQVDNNDGTYGSCNPDCTFAPYCGDGIVDAVEACDDGGRGGCTLDCSATAAICAVPSDCAKVGANIALWTGYETKQPTLAWTGSDFGAVWLARIGSMPAGVDWRLYFARLATDGTKLTADIELDRNLKAGADPPQMRWTGTALRSFGSSEAR